MKKNRELYQALELAGLVPLLAWRKKCFWLAFFYCWRENWRGISTISAKKGRGSSVIREKRKGGEDPWD